MLSSPPRRARSPQRLVDHDPHQPGAERRAPREIADRGEGAEITALHGVLRLGAVPDDAPGGAVERSAEHTSELQSLMRISYAVFCMKKKTHSNKTDKKSHHTTSDLEPIFKTPMSKQK